MSRISSSSFKVRWRMSSYLRNLHIKRIIFFIVKLGSLQVFKVVSILQTLFKWKGIGIYFKEWAGKDSNKLKHQKLTINELKTKKKISYLWNNMILSRLIGKGGGDLKFSFGKQDIITAGGLKDSVGLIIFCLQKGELIRVGGGSLKKRGT